MTAITNAVLIMKDHFIPDGVLFIEDGKIVDFGEMRKKPIPETACVIDAEGLYIGPGFVDIHTHSDGKVFFQDEPQIACDSSCEMVAFGQYVLARNTCGGTKAMFAPRASGG